MKIIFSIVVLLIITLAFRFAYLDRIPTGTSNDELDYILNAKFIYLTGSDISQTWNPLSLTPPKSSFPQAELPPLLTFWLIGPLPLSLANSKLIYALFSIATVYLIYKIARQLFSLKPALFISFIASVNQWLIFFGRSAYDVSIAVFFYLLSLYLIISSKKWKILLAFPTLLIAFYTYVGTKLIILPFVAVTAWFAYTSRNKYLKQYLILILICIVMLSYYVITIFSSKINRVNELVSINDPVFATLVNDERKQSIQTPLTPIFSNKYVVFTKYVAERYLNIFSPSFLFFHGDGKGLFTIWEHGAFYLIESIFFIVGFAVLYSKNKRTLLFLILILLISIIPSVASNTGVSYAVRALLFAPIFIILVGYGLWHIVEYFPKLRLLIIFIYVISILNFINLYYFRNPIYNSESFSFSSRILAKYLSFANEPTYVINGTPRTPYKQFIFYNDWIKQNTVNKISKDYLVNKFFINKISFISCEDAGQIEPTNTVIYDSCSILQKSSQDKTIAQLRDGGAIFTIHNDKLCSGYNLKSYPSNLSFSDLSVENLTLKQLCEKFITHYNID